MKRKSIHKVLALRLILVSLVVCAMLSVIVIVRSRHDIGEFAVGYVMQGVHDFSVSARKYLDVPGVPDRAGLQAELDVMTSHPIHLKYGRSVFGAGYDEDGQEIIRLARDDYERITEVIAYVDYIPDKTEQLADGWQIVRIGGRSHIHVTAPLTNSAGVAVANAIVIFAVSDETLAEVERGIMRAILIALAIVLTTVLLMYPTIVSLMRQQSRLALSLLDSNLETLKVLGSAVAKRDSDTDVHNYRVTIYAANLAHKLGLPPEAIQSLIKGAFLHDVGKVGIADNILLKPGKLSDEEFATMKQHVQHGLDIVGRSHWLDDARDVVGFHHEKIDGSGYLRGLKGEEIPLPARIFSIADVFDALTSRRPYKEPFSYDEAISILEEGRDTHFDGELLDAFEKIGPRLYEQYAGKDDDTPRAEVQRLIERYFSSDEDMMLTH